MSMVDLMWLFCGAFLGGLASLILTAAVSANGESEKREELMIRNKELEEELEFWRKYSSNWKNHSSNSATENE